MNLTALLLSVITLTSFLELSSLSFLFIYNSFKLSFSKFFNSNLEKTYLKVNFLFE